MKTGKLGAASATTYLYNALGQRVKKSGGAATTTVFMYDEAGHLVGEYTISSGTAVRVQETVWLGDIPIATLRTNGTNVDVFYVHTDQLNTPRKVTSNASTPVLRWKWDPTPFGEGTPSEPAGAFKYNLRFPGQYFDSETNLNYNYFRDYDPSLGRYVESDPIGLNGGLNSFAYAGGRPTLAFDPFGLDWIEYTGEVLTMFGGSTGDRGKEILMCRATSGLLDPGVFDYRNKAYQGVNGAGPIPAGGYFVNLSPDPNRIVSTDSSGVTNGSPQGGIERIPGYQPVAGGPTINSPDWGSWRARLQPRPGTKTRGRGGFYLHNSAKGYTHGCIETCDQLLEQLIRVRNSGATQIDVIVDYSDTTTYGRTDK
jgi:RHS repeat-associated protein